MVNSISTYSLTGADRFQLFFDRAARRNKGNGNVIRASVTVKGVLPESAALEILTGSKAVQMISGLTLKKKWYSPIYRLEREDKIPGWEKLLSFHHGKTQDEVLRRVLEFDCPLNGGAPLHVDVAYDKDYTTVIFSVNHVLMDYAGMENLLSSFSEKKELVLNQEVQHRRKSFFRKFAEAVQVTLFVASRSGWNMRRLAGRKGRCSPAVEKLELTPDETQRAKQYATHEIQAGELSFFLGCSMLALSRHDKLLTGERNKFFVAVPLGRRPQANRHSLMSNFLSFLFFRAGESELFSLKEISKSLSAQMIYQAKKGLPEKFSSLQELFKFIPAPVYRAFIDLPGKGHSGTFAFSLPGNSGLENKLFMGLPVTDVTHYAPVISPPGLNIVFTEFNGRLKIMLSFDENRITVKNARELLHTIRKNLIG